MDTRNWAGPWVDEILFAASKPTRTAPRLSPRPTYSVGALTDGQIKEANGRAVNGCSLSHAVLPRRSTPLHEGIHTGQIDVVKALLGNTRTDWEGCALRDAVTPSVSALVCMAMLFAWQCCLHVNVVCMAMLFAWQCCLHAM